MLTGTTLRRDTTDVRSNRAWRVAALAGLLATAARAGDPSWPNAWRAQPPMTAAEARAFMRRLAEFVLARHLKSDDSPQRGMIYEYHWVKQAGTHRQWIQGEALDTMHDGAWFAVAMAEAARVTNDAFYRQVLVRWQLPFYLRMLNESDALFTSERDDSRPGGDRGWRASPEWLLQGREKGFVPYWWDNGASISLDMLAHPAGSDRRLAFAGRNELAGRDNPDARLSGYSLGSSNHKAQDLAVMLQSAFRLFRGSADPVEQALLPQLADAARHLQECRARHGHPAIPAVRAAVAETGDAAARRSLPEATWDSVARARNAWRRAVIEASDEPVVLPGFADDQMYRAYVGLARGGPLAEPEAFQLVYDAFTLPWLYRAYCDDQPAPPGINVFDLHPYRYIRGRPEDYRSDRKGPRGGPRPVGSRFGPQNMAVSAWALMELSRRPGLWDEARRRITAAGFFPTPASIRRPMRTAHEAGELAFGGAPDDPVSGDEVRRALEWEVGKGLRTWAAVFDDYGYIPTGIGCQSALPGVAWDEFSDTGGYAHLIHAAARWIEYLRAKAGAIARAGYPPRRPKGVNDNGRVK